MSRQRFLARSRLPVSARDLFAWHTRPGAFERLAPPWDPPSVIERSGGIEDGARLVAGINVGGLPTRFEVEHTGYKAGEEFRDRQVKGPFAFWEHTHRVVPDGDGAVLEDAIEYELPAGPIGEALAAGFVGRKLEATFGFRHRRLAGDLARHAWAATASGSTIAITGASGFVGRALAAFLTSGGHRVLALVRGGAAGPSEVAWDPDRGTIEAGKLEGLAGVVHLAGESVAGGRWTAERKRRIRDSRVRGTDLLARTLAGLARPPAVLVSASAMGIYGHAPAERHLGEDAPLANDFLGEVAQAWEAAARPARDGGIRVVHPRFTTILDPTGGALARLLPIFRTGVGGRVGSGRQAMSWATLDDTIYAIHRALFDPALAGPVNVATPAPTTNAAFTATLGRVLGRPAALPVPAFALRAAMGEMAESLLLGGASVVPTRLLAAGHRFEHPELEPALAHLLGKGPPLGVWS